MFTTFTGSDNGHWRVIRLDPVIGETLTPASHLAIARNSAFTPGAESRSPDSQGWRLTGFASNVRYVERAEKTQLAATQLPLGRGGATRAALIPIKKSAAWWDLTQEERRAIFEDQSHHIAASLKYLPLIARQLYHARDLGEPFDFLTWFEYPPAAADDFETLVKTLRATEEWRYVEREVDIRLTATN
ncbi:MAG: chlorite dismutase [Bradyrhizobiaceae bacterium]|nr:MAG: chlorite dismutase [Bradyrhizobiaceae bacterium]